MRKLLILMALPLAACAGGPAGAPDLTPLPAEPLTANGRLVAECVRQSLEREAFGAVRDENAGLIRFVCDGAAARALFDGLAERSTRLGSEWREGSVVVRASERVQEDLYGVDLCRARDGGWTCEVHLNVGDFMFD